MKKLKFCVFTISLIFATSCENEALPVVTETESTTEQSSLLKRSCGTREMVKESLRKNPKLAIKMARIEEATGKFSESKSRAAMKYTIPIIVHVLYKKAKQNISNAQIKSQIRVLNKDFKKQNSDISQVPDIFKDIAANTNIQFVLSRVVRKKTSLNVFSDEDEIKLSSRGGSDAIKPRKYLNIWVCNLGGVLGYAYLPGTAPSPNVDGVVITTTAFGSMGNVVAPYDKGRTATHEIGHWLNLEHIWGPETGPHPDPKYNDPFKCANGDHVSDTPTSKEPYIGCPGSNSESCGSKDMTMNYMDYSDDLCMYMFTKGQKRRMRAAIRGPRASYVQ